MDILTGVFNGNSLSGDFLDEIISNGISLDYEAYIAENGEDASDDYCGDNDTYIFGMKKDGKGSYEADETADVAGIFNTNQNTVQIVQSKWCFDDARMCSPCYPNQADMDSVGGGVLGYSVSPDDFNEYEESPIKSMVKPVAELETV